jgi:hypothetical protein
VTDRQLADAAWAEFIQADRPWSAVKGYSRARLASTHWGKGKAYLDMIGRNNNPAPPAVVPRPTDQPYFVWNTVSNVQDLRDGDGGRMTDTTLATMPSGVSSVIKVLVSDALDSSVGGDASFGTTGNLNESWITEGADSWQSCWMLIPDGTNVNYPGTWTHSVISSGWNTFFEYHEPAIAPRSIHIGAWGSDPPVWQFACAGGSTAAPTDMWVRGDTLVYNTWQHHVIHMHWSKNHAGYAEWWIDGAAQMSRTSIPAYDPEGIGVANNFPTAWDLAGTFKAPYYQTGHYRGPSRPDVDTTYIARVMVGPTRISVEG